MSTGKERIIYYLENQGIKKEDFYKKISSNGTNFRGKALKSELSGNKIAEILSFYPEINTEWLVLGQGPMLRTPHEQMKLEESHTIYNNQENFEKKYFRSIEEKENLYKEIIKLHEEISDLKDTINSHLKKSQPSSSDNTSQL